MKKIRKMYSLFLVITLMFSSMTVANAATTLTTEEKAEVLYELGLFDGVSTIEFDPDLNSSANREQAAKMLVVALGWSVDTSGDSGFADVSDWAQPYVAKAVEEGVTNGIGKDQRGVELFGAQDDITARQLATWFDRIILGTGTEWDDNDKLDDQNGITRGDLVDETYEALKQTPSGSSESLIETIVGDDMELTKIAIDGGLINMDTQSGIGERPGMTNPNDSDFSDSYPQDTNPAYDPVASDDDDDDDDGEVTTITDIDVDDYDTIIITFSDDIDEDSAEEEYNYFLYDDDWDYIDDAFDDIEYTDTNEVTITFEDDLAGDYIILVSGVEDEDGDDIASYEEFEVENDEEPYITDINVTDEDTIVITFSEDLDDDTAEDEDNYELYDDDDDEVDDIFEDIELTDDDEVTITFTEDLDGEYTIVIEDVEDEDGDEVDDSEEFEVDEDDLAIDSISVEDEDEIIITFNVDLDEDTAEDDDYYTLYDEDGDEVDDIIDDIDLTDDDEVTITFTEDLDGDYTIEIDGVEDEDGDEIDEEEDFEVEAEDLDIVSISVEDEDEIIVTFNRDVDEDTAEDEDNYTLYDEDGEEVEDIFDEIEVTDDEEVTITFTEDLDGDYTLDIDGVEDEDGNDMDEQESFEVD